MNQELKNKIRTSMIEYLTSKGWPDKLSHDQIIQELPNLWTKLEREGLLKDDISKGFNFTQFRNIALQKKQEHDTFSKIREFFNRGE